MRQQPPQELTALLERLGLAGEGPLRGARRRARQLARGLPLVDPVWVDALAQARLLTAYQATEINAGRGAALRVGPYVLRRPLRPMAMGCAAWYQARDLGSGQPVHLAVARVPPDRVEHVLAQLQSLADESTSLPSDCFAPVMKAGADGDRVWTASRPVAGRTAAQWLIHHGRFPPAVVLEIARQMAAGLRALEKAGLCHGSIGASNLMLTSDGQAVLPQPGLRAVLRPDVDDRAVREKGDRHHLCEAPSGPFRPMVPGTFFPPEIGQGHLGFADADLPPECYDGLAPERIVEGSPQSIRGDVFACGALWWHLLAGRSPLPGANGLAKMQAIATVRVPDVRSQAMDTPAVLADAIAESVHRDPSRRPNPARLADMLGPSTHKGRLALARWVRGPGRRYAHWAVAVKTVRHSSQTPLWLTAAAACVVAAAVGVAGLWQSLVVPGRPTEPQARVKVSHPTEPSRPYVPAGSGELVFTSENLWQITDEWERMWMLDQPDDPRRTEGPFPLTPNPSPAGGEGRIWDDPSPARGEGRMSDNLLLLPDDKPLRIESLQVQPGQRVSGQTGRRPMLVVPAAGLVIAAENVRFEGIDFVWQNAVPGDGKQIASCLIRLRASRAEFRGCSFQGPADGPLPAAIAWVWPPDESRAGLSLPSGQVRLSDCVLRNVSSGVACDTVGAVSIDLVNVLHLGPGPLLRMARCPKADEPATFALTNVTLRDTGPLVEWTCSRPEEQPGRIAIRASGSVFFVRPETALLVFASPETPGPILEGLEWSGQGTLVSPGAIIAAWRRSDGRLDALDDGQVAMAGVVRSEVHFAGSAGEGPAASRIVRWQAPLRSANAPGIDPKSPAFP